MSIVPVILCGGSGTRLWPRSRKTKPKPFVSLIGDTTLFEATLARCSDKSLFSRPVIVTGVDHLGHVEDQSSDDINIIVEPEAKNTAAAIALAAHRVPADAVMLVCPSDHYIANVEAFSAATESAAALALQGWLVAFGIEAKSAETGFGYIKRGESISGTGYRVSRFVEKPDLDTARSFVADGNYSWNGGLFAFTAGRFLEELSSYRPILSTAVQKAVEEGSEEGQHFHPNPSIFATIESESVDYAVMEETDRAAVVPVDMGWSDIGNWVALREAKASDEHGNVAPESAELVDCRNIMVDSDGPRVSVIGLEDVTVVVSGNDVMVTSDRGSQKVGKLSGAANQ